MRRPERIEANQALLSSEGWQIRGFARRAAAIASTGQRNQERKPTIVRYNKGELISLSMPPLLFPNEDNGGSNVPKQRVRTFGVLLNFYGHRTENVENIRKH